jgi:hypothetical protein
LKLKKTQTLLLQVLQLLPLPLLLLQSLLTVY